MDTGTSGTNIPVITQVWAKWHPKKAPGPHNDLVGTEQYSNCSIPKCQANSNSWPVGRPEEFRKPQWIIVWTWLCTVQTPGAIIREGCSRQQFQFLWLWKKYLAFQFSCLFIEPYLKCHQAMWDVILISQDAMHCMVSDGVFPQPSQGWSNWWKEIRVSHKLILNIFLISLTTRQWI